MGALHLVAVPIGHPDDLTVRALAVLRSVARIAAEDTRTTRALLAHHGIEARLVSYHDHNEADRVPVLLGWLAEGDLALVSEAGTPLVSDPGYRLVQAAIAAGVPIHVLPGPCAAVAALTGGGLPTDRFHFLGFLPTRDAAREAAFAEDAALTGTLIYYESPRRLGATLGVLARLWPARRVVVARNLTKAHEQWLRGDAASVLEALGDEVRGEVVLLVEGAPASAPKDDEAVDARIDALLAGGLDARRVRDVVAAETGRPRREVYARVLARR